MGNYKRFQQTSEQYVVTVKIGCETGKEIHKRGKRTTTITHYATWPETFNIPQIKSEVVDRKCRVCHQTLHMSVYTIPEARKEKIKVATLITLTISGIIAVILIIWALFTGVDLTTILEGDADTEFYALLLIPILYALYAGFQAIDAMLGKFEAKDLIRTGSAKHTVLGFLDINNQLRPTPQKENIQYALILAQYPPSREKQLVQLIQDIAQVPEEKARLLLKVPSLIKQEVSNQEAAIAVERFNQIQAQVKLITMEQLLEIQKKQQDNQDSCRTNPELEAKYRMDVAQLDRPISKESTRAVSSISPGAEKVIVMYLEALRQQEFQQAIALLSDYSLLLSDSNRENVRIEYIKKFFEGWRLIEYGTRESRMLGHGTALIHVFMKEKFGNNEPQTSDSWWSLHQEQGQWRVNINHIVDDIKLNIEPQTMNGVIVQPIWIIRHINKLVLWLNIENSNERTVLWGGEGKQIATFWFGNQPVNQSGGLQLQPRSTATNCFIPLGGWYEMYPARVELRNWKFVSTSDLQSVDLKSESWVYTYTFFKEDKAT